MPIFESHIQVRVQRPESDGKVLMMPPQHALQHAGPILQVTVSPTKQHIDALISQGQTPPEAIPGYAIIDTGASMTAVDEDVCRRLGLQPTGSQKTAHAGGPDIRACYPIQVSFPGTPLPSFSTPRAMSVNLQFGKTPYILLFGRDLLARIKFVYNGPAGRIGLAF
jgi:hypothetical protein